MRELSPPVPEQDAAFLGHRESSPDVRVSVTLSPDSAMEELLARSETKEPSGGTSGSDGTSAPEYIRTPFGRAVSPLDLSYKSTSISNSPLVSSPARTFNPGSVICALVGNPTVAEVNLVLVASATYGCSRTILPQSAEGLEHLELPPSATVEYSPGVLDAVREVGNRRGMALVSVFARATSSAAVHLLDFEHPPTCIYVFSAAAGVRAEDVEGATQATVYVFNSGPPDVIPINECFSRRSSSSIARETESGGSSRAKPPVSAATGPSGDHEDPPVPVATPPPENA